MFGKKSQVQNSNSITVISGDIGISPMISHYSLIQMSSFVCFPMIRSIRACCCQGILIPIDRAGITNRFGAFSIISAKLEFSRKSYKTPFVELRFKHRTCKNLKFFI